MAVGRIHGWNTRGDGLVGIANARSGSARPGLLDGVGPPVQQRHVRRLDLRRRPGDPAVHLLRRGGGSVPGGSRRQSLGADARFPEPCGGRADAAGGTVDRGLLLRLVRRPAGRSFAAATSRAPEVGPAGSSLRLARLGALSVPVRLLRRVAPEHVLRQTRSAVVRVGDSAISGRPRSIPGSTCCCRCPCWRCGAPGGSEPISASPCRSSASFRTWPMCCGSEATTSSTARWTSTGRCWRCLLPRGSFTWAPPRRAG